MLLGLAGAVGVARLLASELYQVRGSDPLVIAGTAATVIAVALGLLDAGVAGVEVRSDGGVEGGVKRDVMKTASRT